MTSLRFSDWNTSTIVFEDFDGDKAFCPTGPGGGVDPTCGSGGGGPSALKSTGFNVMDMDDLDPSVSAHLVTELNHLKSIAPSMVDHLGSIRSAKLPSGTPFTYRTEGGEKSLLIDKSQLSGKALERTTADIQRAQKSGWLASGDGIRGVIAHELAHAIDKAPFNAQFKFGVNVGAAKMYLKKNQPTKKDLSGYGTEKGPHQNEEAFAEAYAAHRTKTESVTKWQAGFNAALTSARKDFDSWD